MLLHTTWPTKAIPVCTFLKCPPLSCPRPFTPHHPQRDLQPWEELTYDYRFSSSVELPCNCGADTCRVFVNWPGSGREEEEDEEDEEDGEGEGPEEHVGMGEDGGKEGVRG